MQQEKLQKEALKNEAAEAKKLEKERQKWEKGKFALKSMMAEIDAKIIENGSVGGMPILSDACTWSCHFCIITIFSYA